ncbi:zinc-binding dehydrogenase [Streptomyces virginiae]|uniref:zinc-binding dehydrogenase n=1 Tax=Streptomyces virginiae TaxID=1961 RepID=UPI0035D63DC6
MPSARRRSGRAGTSTSTAVGVVAQAQGGRDHRGRTAARAREFDEADAVGAQASQLAAAAPEGIDVYLDAVGGDHLQAAIGAIRPGGRIAMVGAISGYNATRPAPGPDNLFRAAAHEVTLRGMLVSSHFDLFPEWIGRAAPRPADGTLRTEETVVDGIERAADAFLGVLSGADTGKTLVRPYTARRSR